MKKKLFTLFTLMLCLCSGAWAADYTVTATRELSNSNKTSAWSKITANSGTAFEGGKTAMGDGMYFDATGKCTLGGGQINVKANAIMYLEVPSASAAGSVTIVSGNATDRYFETPSGAKLYMKETTSGDGNNSVTFTSADIVTIDGVDGSWLKLTSKSDNKFNGVTITLTSGTYITMLEAPTFTVDASTGSVTIVASANASSIKYTTDGTDPSTTNGETYSTAFTVTDGTVVKAMAIGDGTNYGNSGVASTTVLLSGVTLATPVIKHYNGSVAITCTSPGATIKVSTDGGTTYSDYARSFTLSEDATVKAYATRENCTDSEIASADVTVPSISKAKTLYLYYSLFTQGTAEGASAKNLLTGNSGTDAEGYTIAITGRSDKELQSASNITVNGTAMQSMKVSNGAQNTVTIPAGVHVTGIRLISYNNYADNYVYGWQEVNGVKYNNSGDDSYYQNVPCEANGTFSDYLTNPDVRVYAIDNVTDGGSITFTNAGNQMCYVIGLDILEDVEVSSIFPDGGSVDGNSIVTISATGTVKYQWSESNSAAIGEGTWTEGTTVTVPNVNGTRYLHVYATNGIDNTTITTKAFTITKVSTASVTTTWDFTEAMSATDIANLKADDTNWTWTESSDRYANKTSIEAGTTITANGSTLEKLAGLTFSAFGSADRLRINNGSYLQMNGSNFYFTIPGLNVGDKVAITYLSASTNNESRSWTTPSNAKLSSADGTQSINGSTETEPKTVEYTVTTAGDTQFKQSKGLNIKSIVLTATTNAVETTLASSGLSSFSSSKALDFSQVEGLTAYAVTSVSATAVTMTSVDAAPAATGLVLKGTGSETYSIPVASATPAAVEGNKLVATVERTNVGANNAWVLNGGEFKLYTGEYLPAGKAYLPATEVPAVGEARLTMLFDGETTGINAASNEVLGDGRFFDLQGRQVSLPQNGLYIVNGKKVIIK